MKKYIKPAIEVLNIGATMPLMVASVIFVDTDGTVIDPTGSGGSAGQWAPGKKGHVYVEVDDEEDFGW